MSRLVLLCVECDSRSRTDYMYITSTIKHYYIDDRKVIYRPIFLGSKTKYSDRGKISEILDAGRDFSGEVAVIYFIDTDSINVSNEARVLNRDIQEYCQKKGYDLVFFCEDIEDVYLGNPIHNKEKVRMAEQFNRNQQINCVNEKMLRSEQMQRHKSNILNVLDKYWKRKGI